MSKGVPNIKPCRHGEPMKLGRLDEGYGHWLIANDCCESVIDWDRLRLVRGWNADRRPAAPSPEEK